MAGSSAFRGGEPAAPSSTRPWTRSFLAEAPRHVVLCLDDFVAAGADLLATVGDTDKRVLDWVQRFLAEEPLAGSTLVVLTRLALDTGAGESIESLPGASVWGLIRSAQTEHPGRFRLVDIDDEETSWARLPDAFALDEGQLALRDGAYLIPPDSGLARGPPDRPAGARRPPSRHPEQGDAGEPDLGPVPRGGSTADERSGPDRRAGRGAQLPVTSPSRWGWWTERPSTQGSAARAPESCWRWRTT